MAVREGKKVCSTFVCLNLCVCNVKITQGGGGKYSGASLLADNGFVEDKYEVLSQVECLYRI